MQLSESSTKAVNALSKAEAAADEGDVAKASILIAISDRWRDLTYLLLEIEKERQP